MTDPEARTTRAARLLPFSPLLAFGLVPWLVDLRTSSLMPALLALAVGGAVLSIAVLLDGLRRDEHGENDQTMVVAAALGLLASVATAITISGSGSVDGTIRQIAGVTVVLLVPLAAVNVWRWPTVFVVLAALVLVPLSASSAVRGAITYDDAVDRRVGRLVEIGFDSETGYVPVIDGLRPARASLRDSRVSLVYEDDDDDTRFIVSVSYGDLCSEVSGPLSVECSASASTLGGAGGDRFGVRLADGTVLVLLAEGVEPLTAEQVDDLDRAEPQPLRELAELIADSDGYT